ncbi:MAG: DUF5053 domain-containing protein [Niabella sp.]|nr:DUF5053 domain-containing protein [Niabella sp.]
MNKELNKLMKLAGTVQFDAALDRLYEKYKDDAMAKKAIAAYIKKGVAASGERINGVAVKMQLAEVSEIISLSYIAKTYFNKTKSWLSQRVNGHTVNGKAALFTADEMKTLNFALKDVGKKIGSTSVHL